MWRCRSQSNGEDRFRESIQELPSLFDLLAFESLVGEPLENGLTGDDERSLRVMGWS